MTHVYLTIRQRARVVYEQIDSQRGAAEYVVDCRS